MDGADVVSYHLRLGQIGSVVEADAVGMKARPPRGVLLILFDAAFTMARSQRRDDRRVDAARYQYTVGDVAHHLSHDIGFEG